MRLPGSASGCASSQAEGFGSVVRSSVRWLPESSSCRVAASLWISGPSDIAEQHCDQSGGAQAAAEAGSRRGGDELDLGAGGDAPGAQHACIDAAPAGVRLLRDAREAALRKERG